MIKLNWKNYGSNIEVFVEDTEDIEFGGYVNSIGITLDYICSADDYELYEGDACLCSQDFVNAEISIIDSSLDEEYGLSFREIENHEEFYKYLESIVWERVNSYFYALEEEEEEILIP